MRSKLTLFAAVCLAALALSTPASAATILQFVQTAPQSSTDFVQATLTGGTSPPTTLTSHGPATSPNSIPITITQLGAFAPASIPGFETFFALTSGAPVSGGEELGFSGTVVISTTANPNILTAVVTNGRLVATSGAGAFADATATFTSNDPFIMAALGGTGAPTAGPVAGAFGLGFSGVNPQQSGSGFTNFTAQNTGTFSTVSAVPEPASFLSAGTAILAGLGCFGWSRRKSSHA